MDRFDLLAVLGVILITTGAGLIYIPAGLIVGGLACVGVGVLGAAARSRDVRQAVKRNG